MEPFEKSEKILPNSTLRIKNQPRVVEDRTITAKNFLKGILLPSVKNPRFKMLPHIFKLKQIQINIYN
jgi:hypothetical protein